MFVHKIIVSFRFQREIVFTQTYNSLLNERNAENPRIARDFRLYPMSGKHELVKKENFKFQLETKWKKFSHGTMLNLKLL